MRDLNKELGKQITLFPEISRVTNDLSTDYQKFYGASKDGLETAASAADTLADVLAKTAGEDRKAKRFAQGSNTRSQLSTRRDTGRGGFSRRFAGLEH